MYVRGGAPWRKCVKLLAAYGADPDARDDQGFTAAMWAGFKHPQDSALLSAIAAATNNWMRRKNAEETNDVADV